MNKFLYAFATLFIITSCTKDEGVNFQPDSFFISTENNVVNESDGSIDVLFNIANASNTDLTINYTISGTATEVVDYTLAGLSVVISAGETVATLPVNLIDDALIEELEDIIITVTDTSDTNLFIDESDQLTLTIIDDESIAYQNGLLVSNFGNAVAGTITFINDDYSVVEQEIYNTVNSEAVGNGLLSIGFNNEKAYLIATNSNKITVVNRYSFLKEATIETGLNNPRYLAVSGEKAYVTNWGDPVITTDDTVEVIDLITNTIENSIPVSEGPERIVEKNGKLYIAHKGGLNQNNIISIIDSTDETITEITVGDVPNEMVFDTANNLWILCEGNPASSGLETGGQLVKLNTFDNSTTAINFGATEHPTTLAYETENLYYELAGNIYTLQETETVLPTTAIIATNTNTIRVKDGLLYTTDTTDMVSNGNLIVFDLTDNSEAHNVSVGVIPGGIYFN